MNIVIIGGGASGMLAAAALKKRYETLEKEKVKIPSQVILLEKNEKLGKKLFITGKGRCNVTNDCDKDTFYNSIVTNSKFMYSAFSTFSNKDLEKLIEENGCVLKVERGDRVFPLSDKSYDIIDALKKSVKSRYIKVKLNFEVKSVEKNEEQFVIKSSTGETVYADKVIIATGGLSYSSTGSTGDGYKFAKSFGHTVHSPIPSLVPLNVEEVADCKSMQGLTLKNVAIHILNKENNKVVYNDFGELLFTHFGVSGPVILSASCYLKDLSFGNSKANSSYILSIDLKPALDREKLEDRILREFDENKTRKLKTVIENLLPSSMVAVFMDRLNTFDKKVSEVDKSLRNEIIRLLKDFRFTITSKRDFNEAIITSGGIDIKEINPKTMESKIESGLYFAGEVIDVDALTGGFNIQIAASTGFGAGNSIDVI